MDILGVTIGMTVLWLVAAIVFLIIEALTMGLTTIWFSGGAIAALVVSLLGAGIAVQIVLFLVVSLVLLVFTRRIFVGKLKTGSEKTNVDALIGEEAIVLSKIEPFNPGIIKLNGQEWTAICGDDDSVVDKSQKVKVIAIEGVKAIVEPVRE